MCIRDSRRATDRSRGTARTGQRVVRPVRRRRRLGGSRPGDAIIADDIEFFAVVNGQLGHVGQLVSVW